MISSRTNKMTLDDMSTLSGEDDIMNVDTDTENDMTQRTGGISHEQHIHGDSLVDESESSMMNEDDDEDVVQHEHQSLIPLQRPPSIKIHNTQLLTSLLSDNHSNSIPINNPLIALTTTKQSRGNTARIVNTYSNDVIANHDDDDIKQNANQNENVGSKNSEGVDTQGHEHAYMQKVNNNVTMNDSTNPTIINDDKNNDMNTVAQITSKPTLQLTTDVNRTRINVDMDTDRNHIDNDLDTRVQHVDHETKQPSILTPTTMSNSIEGLHEFQAIEATLIQQHESHEEENIHTVEQAAGDISHRVAHNNDLSVLNDINPVNSNDHFRGVTDDHSVTNTQPQISNNNIESIEAENDNHMNNDTSRPTDLMSLLKLYQQPLQLIFYRYAHIHTHGDDTTPTYVMNLNEFLHFATDYQLLRYASSQPPHIRLMQQSTSNLYESTKIPMSKKRIQQLYMSSIQSIENHNNQTHDTNVNMNLYEYIECLVRLSNYMYNTQTYQTTLPTMVDKAYKLFQILIKKYQTIDTEKPKSPSYPSQLQNDTFQRPLMSPTKSMISSASSVYTNNITTQSIPPISQMLEEQSVRKSNKQHKNKQKDVLSTSTQSDIQTYTQKQQQADTLQLDTNSPSGSHRGTQPLSRATSRMSNNNTVITAYTNGTNYSTDTVTARHELPPLPLPLPLQHQHHNTHTLHKQNSQQSIMSGTDSSVGTYTHRIINDTRSTVEYPHSLQHDETYPSSSVSNIPQLRVSGNQNTHTAVSTARSNVSGNSKIPVFVGNQHTHTQNNGNENMQNNNTQQYHTPPAQRQFTFQTSPQPHSNNSTHSNSKLPSPTTIILPPILQHHQHQSRSTPHSRGSSHVSVNSYANLKPTSQSQSQKKSVAPAMSNSNIQSPSTSHYTSVSQQYPSSQQSHMQHPQQPLMANAQLTTAEIVARVKQQQQLQMQMQQNQQKMQHMQQQYTQLQPLQQPPAQLQLQHIQHTIAHNTQLPNSNNISASHESTSNKTHKNKENQKNSLPINTNTNNNNSTQQQPVKSSSSNKKSSHHSHKTSSVVSAPAQVPLPVDIQRHSSPTTANANAAQNDTSSVHQHLHRPQSATTARREIAINALEQELHEINQKLHGKNMMSVNVNGMENKKVNMSLQPSTKQQQVKQLSNGSTHNKQKHLLHRQHSENNTTSTASSKKLSLLPPIQQNSNGTRQLPQSSQSQHKPPIKPAVPSQKTLQRSASAASSAAVLPVLHTKNQKLLSASPQMNGNSRHITQQQQPAVAPFKQNANVNLTTFNPQKHSNPPVLHSPTNSMYIAASQYVPVDQSVQIQQQQPSQQQYYAQSQQYQSNVNGYPHVAQVQQYPMFTNNQPLPQQMPFSNNHHNANSYPTQSQYPPQGNYNVNMNMQMAMAQPQQQPYNYQHFPQHQYINQPHHHAAPAPFITPQQRLAQMLM